MYLLENNWQGGAVYIDDGGSLTTDGKVTYTNNVAVRFAFGLVVHVLGSVSMNEHCASCTPQEHHRRE